MFSDVSMAEIHLLFVGIPVLVVAILAALIFSRKGPHPKTYTLSEQWTHAPILWASDEPADHGHAHPLTVGGGASGKW
jgi:hypothetical protein